MERSHDSQQEVVYVCPMEEEDEGEMLIKNESNAEGEEDPTTTREDVDDNSTSEMQNASRRKSPIVFKTSTKKEDTLSVIEALCDNCRKNTAMKFCCSCKYLKRFCMECAELHDQRAKFKEHQLQNIEDVIFCKEHPTNNADEYCLTCKAVICETCVVCGTHNSHVKQIVCLKSQMFAAKQKLQEYISGAAIQDLALSSLTSYDEKMKIDHKKLLEYTGWIKEAWNCLQKVERIDEIIERNVTENTKKISEVIELVNQHKKVKDMAESYLHLNDPNIITSADELLLTLPPPINDLEVFDTTLPKHLIMFKAGLHCSLASRLNFERNRLVTLNLTHEEQQLQDASPQSPNSIGHNSSTRDEVSQSPSSDAQMMVSDIESSHSQDESADDVSSITDTGTEELGYGLTRLHIREFMQTCKSEKALGIEIMKKIIPQEQRLPNCNVAGRMGRPPLAPGGENDPIIQFIYRTAMAQFPQNRDKPLSKRIQEIREGIDTCNRHLRNSRSARN